MVCMVLESVAAMTALADNITINSGFIDAKSVYSAGIGSGYYGSCDNITINSGFIDAKSEFSAGIGGGYVRLLR